MHIRENPNMDGIQIGEGANNQDLLVDPSSVLNSVGKAARKSSDLLLIGKSRACLETHIKKAAPSWVISSHRQESFR